PLQSLIASYALCILYGHSPRIVLLRALPKSSNLAASWSEGAHVESVEMLAVLTERLERVSAHYAERFAIRRDDDWYMMKLGEELGELTQAWLKLTGRGRR